METASGPAHISALFVLDAVDAAIELNEPMLDRSRPLWKCYVIEALNVQEAAKRSADTDSIARRSDSPGGAE